MNIYILFIHALKSKPNALEEKKMKVYGEGRGEMQVIDWSTSRYFAR